MYINQDLHITRYLNGIKLVKPNLQGHTKTRKLSEIMNIPVHMFMSRADNLIAESNDLCIENFGFDSRANTIGNTFENICANKSEIKKVYANDRRVMTTARVHIFDEMAALTNGEFMHTISFKMPWYSEDNKVMGIFGCSTLLKNIAPETIARNITYMSDIFLPGSSLKNIAQNKSNDILSYYSPRELDVIGILVRGKTVREAANQLGLSVRTVESYVVNIKCKANVATKSELIEKFADCF